MKSFAKNILDKIDKEQITPLPKWRFLLKNILFWMLVAIFVVFGGVAFSIFVYLLKVDDLLLFANADSLEEFALAILPFLWVIILVGAILLSVRGVQHTKKGYRISSTLIIFATVIASIVLGIGFYTSGMSAGLDRIFAENLPGYRFLDERRRMFFYAPAEGRLAGLVQELHSNGLVILAPDRSLWQVDIKSVRARESLPIRVGMPIRFVGEQTGKDSFAAFEMHPGKPRHMPMRGQRHMPIPEMENGMPPRPFW